VYLRNLSPLPAEAKAAMDAAKLLNLQQPVITTFCIFETINIITMSRQSATACP